MQLELLCLTTASKKHHYFIVLTCSVIPSGVLCFLPSYTLLNKLVERWKVTGLWKELNKLKRFLIGKFSHLLSNNLEPQKNNEGEFNQVMQQYYHAVKQQNGAVLIAVCRGKVSEVSAPINY